MRAFPNSLGIAVLLLGPIAAGGLPPVMAADVQFRIVPVISPGTTDLNSLNPPAGVTSLPSGSAWTAEIWATDSDDPVHGTTGLIASYLNVHWSPALPAVLSTHHSALFPAFLGTEPSVNGAAGRVLNLGGVVDRLDRPRGAWPEWVRIGWIRYAGTEVTRPTIIEVGGQLGLGGVGCYGRNCGGVEVIGGNLLITPEPATGLAVVGLVVVVTGIRRRGGVLGVPSRTGIARCSRARGSCDRTPLV